MTMLDPLREAFYTRQVLNPLSGGQVALWHALAYTREKSHQREWFTIAGMALAQLSGLSPAGVKKARNELKQQGLIDFRANNTRATAYKLLDIADSSRNSIQNSSRNSIQNSSRNSIQNSSRNSSALYKQQQQNMVVLCASPLMTDEEMDQAANSATVNAQKLYAAMEDAGMTMSGKVIGCMEALVAEYGMDAVLDALDKAAEHDNRGGVNVAYLRKILSNLTRSTSQDGTDEQRRSREEAATLALLRGEIPD